MISKLSHQIVRELTAAPRFKIVSNHAKANTFQSNKFWWPLWVIGSIGYTKLYIKGLAPKVPEDESQKMLRLYAEEEKRVRRCSESPETLGEHIAAKIHDYIATPIVRKLCDLDLHGHLVQFDFFGVFFPEKPILPFYILYMLISFLVSFISIIMGWGERR